MDFIAIDFEIANRNYDSACSLGMVFVQDNKIVDQKYYLIKPPTNNMDPQMTGVHGITFDDVKNAPSFNEIWNKVSHHFHQDTYIVAHNARFDMNVLKNCLLTYNFDIPDFNYACSIPITTRACRGEGVPNSLEARAERFGIIMDKHHNALSDAKTVAELVLTCIKLKKRRSIHTYFSTYSSIPIRSLKELKHDSTFRGGRSFEKIKITNIKPEKDEFIESHPLFNKAIVFTGELDSLSRTDAMQKVVNVGGIIRSAVSRKTNYLIVGTQDKKIVGSSGQSSKERKAAELIEQGYDLQIINENDFINLLEYKVHS